MPDGTNERIVVPAASGKASFNPTWSADGTQISFVEIDPSDPKAEDAYLGRLFVKDIASGKTTMLDNRVFNGFFAH